MRRLLLPALALLTTVLYAEDPDGKGFPVVPPRNERVFAVDAHASWTLRSGEAAVPLAVVPTPTHAVLALAGGWVVLGADLEFLPLSFDLLAKGQPVGSPWAQPVDDAVVFVTGSPGDLAVLYPDVAVIQTRRAAVNDLSHFAVTDQGFLFVQSRRTTVAEHWGKALREGQPLPFFPADVTAAPDGTAWGADSLQARPWRQEEGFWKPLEFPQSPGRLTTLAPFPDSTGYFAGGPGWVGAFSSDGSAFWVRDKDLSGLPLPRDVRLRAGPGRLYLWSAQARKVWCWNWDQEGASGPVAAPSTDRLAEYIRGEIDRLEALGSVPEAMAVAQYGLELSQTVLKAQPFLPAWTRAASEFAGRRVALRDRVVGAGVFSLTWDSPFGKPVATWTWEPDAAWLDVTAWRASGRPFWQGRPYEPEDFRLAVTAEKTPWPAAEDYHDDALRLPSWMNVELRPEGSDAAVHWVRVPLPSPPVPYDLPVE